MSDRRPRGAGRRIETGRWAVRETGFAMRLEAGILPDLGTGPGVPIVVSHWFAARGDEVWEGDRLVEVLVGPATFDVPAPATGRLAEIRGREDHPAAPRPPPGPGGAGHHSE